MCTECGNVLHFDAEKMIETYQDNLEKVQRLADVVNSGEMTERDKVFGSDLVGTFIERNGGLTPRQMEWVVKLADRYIKIEPMYGDFDKILVMMKIAGEKMKRPRIRLLTNEERFVQLNFDSEHNEIEVYVDGWQGHGYRKFAGWIRRTDEGTVIVPYQTDRMTDDVKNCIQDFSMDPEQISKAMAKRLGCCIYCGSRLSDDRSKEVGYGPVCAKNYKLPW